MQSSGIHHNAQVRVCCEDLPEAQDVGVVQAPVIQDLPLHILVQEHICSPHAESM